MEEIYLVLNETMYKEEGVNAPYRWPSVYAHGQIEVDFGYDIVTFDQSMPSEGYYLATADNHRTVVVHLADDGNGRLHGRCAYIDDPKGMEHVNRPQDWQ